VDNAGSGNVGLKAERSDHGLSAAIAAEVRVNPLPYHPPQRNVVQTAMAVDSAGSGTAGLKVDRSDHDLAMEKARKRLEESEERLR